MSARCASVCAGACQSLCTCVWCGCVCMLDLECVGLRARVGACTHVKTETSDLGPWKAGFQGAQRWSRQQGGGLAPRGLLWEKNSLKMGTPLKSPQSPQVWLAYLASSSSCNERTHQAPAMPGTPPDQKDRRGSQGCSSWASAQRTLPTCSTQLGPGAGGLSWRKRPPHAGSPSGVWTLGPR